MERVTLPVSVLQKVEQQVEIALLGMNANLKLSRKKSL